MDLNRLRHFLAVAQDLHFGAAARKLGMEQSSISQSVAALEKSIGVKLLERSSRSVSLTPAGEVLVEDARRLLQQSDQAQERARGAAHRDSHQLRVGHVPFSLIKALPPAIRTFQARHADVQVRLVEEPTAKQIASLRSGTLDLGLVNLKIADLSGLNVRPLYTARMMLAVPAGWPLAQSQLLHLRDLRDYPFVMFPPEWNPSFSRDMAATLARQGLVPKVRHIAEQALTLMTLVAEEFGVALVHESACGARVAGVKFVALAESADLLSIEMGLAWMPSHKSHLVTTLVTALQDLVSSEGTGQGPVKAALRRVV
ncbi:LysR family transcriptional regulator [Ramlibacter sp. WS9]|uniref:LysR family transcriptional regulator n=1 Tax=Ramlibacter sp. WS9 TaxID=1882741 RepID=UPI0011451A36|nr:LysR family transcriptional regulator [Ramlibacter sp. WS9]ROZ69152.1 LysR family transcriptional regulator [Ramlibacter sp. WS9]